MLIHKIAPRNTPELQFIQKKLNSVELYCSLLSQTVVASDPNGSDQEFLMIHPIWKNEIRTGFMASLIALPLSLGIAMASGFPAASGVVTAIIGGLVASRFHGAPLTIKGPAAGLIVIVLAGVTELGSGDLVIGYPKLLAAIINAGVLQIILGSLRLGRFSSMIPPSVVHGMLAGIGVIIFAKQFPIMLGVAPMASSPLDLIKDISHTVSHANLPVAGLGIASLFLILFYKKLPVRLVSMVPAQLVAVILAIPAAVYFDFSHAHDLIVSGEHFKVGPDYLVHIPGKIFASLAFPEWRSLLDVATWKYVLLLTLIGSAESLLTVQAVDAIDPAKTKSDLDGDLIAVGIGNVLCGLVGALPMISEIVRSRANIDNGAKTSWSNFFHGGFLVLALFMVPGVLSLIPLSVLASMLLVTAYRLASPDEFAKIYRIGWDQMVIFLVTMILTVTVDLLAGVLSGVGLKVILHFIRGLTPRDFLHIAVEKSVSGKHMRLKIHGAVVFSNFFKVQAMIDGAGPEISMVTIDFSEARFVDHTALKRLHAAADSKSNAVITMEGLDQLRSRSNHELATRHA